MVRHSVSKSSKLLALLLSCIMLAAVCCVGCSSSKNTVTKDPAPKPATEKPAAMDPVVPMPSAQKAERFGTVYDHLNRPQDVDMYQEPANKKSQVTGKVRLGDQFRILDEKDFHVLVETEDKRKGWVLKRKVAEYFFIEPQDKKDGKQLPVPDALAIFQPGFEENEVEPAVWYEVCPKIDLDLYAFPNVKAPVVATAKANKRYLITETAMVGFPKLSYREFPNGAKGSHIVGLGFEASVFYHEGKVFETSLGTEYTPYSGFKNIERFDPDFKNLGKYRNHWLRLQTEDGTEGWTKSYWFEDFREWSGLWNMAFFFARLGDTGSPELYLHVKEHPIKILSRTYKQQPLYADSGKGSVAFTNKELEYHDFMYFYSRVKVLEEKGDMSRIQSYRNGMKVWVPSKYLMDYTQAYVYKIEETRKFLQRNGTKSYSAFTLQEFPKESEMKKLDAVMIRTGVITGTEVRMRKDGNMRGEVLGYFDKGEKVTIMRTKEGWHKVKRANNAVGWVRSDFCKEEEK